MKTELKLRVQAVWQTLTEVPGWPDAPLPLRIRRILPITVPALAFAALITWQLGFVRPRMAADRAAHAPILSLIDEVEALRSVSPELDAADIALQAEKASRMLLENKTKLGEELLHLQKVAHEAGWEATFQPLPSAEANEPTGKLIEFVEARGRLVALASNHEPYTTLIGYLDKLSEAVSGLILPVLWFVPMTGDAMPLRFLFELAADQSHEKFLNNPKVVGTLCAAAALCAAYSYWSDRKTAAALLAFDESGEIAEASGLQAPSPVSANLSAIKAALAELAPGSRPRDPFVFPKPVVQEVEKKAEPQDQVDNVHLSAVWLQNDATFLIVNGKILSRGDSVGGLVIDEVTREGAWFSHWKGRDFVAIGKRFELKTPAHMLATVAAR